MRISDWSSDVCSSDLATVQSHCQAITAGVDALHRKLKFARLERRDMQHGTEDLAPEIFDLPQADYRRRPEVAMLASRRQRALRDHVKVMGLDVRKQDWPGSSVAHRSNAAGKRSRIPEHQDGN